MTIAGLHLRGLPDWSRRLAAAGAIVVVLAVGAVAASPSLHLRLHPDAGRVDHECAVTLFAHGAVEALTGIALTVVPLWRVAALAAVPAGPDLVAPRYRLNPGRAPPGA